MQKEVNKREGGSLAATVWSELTVSWLHSLFCSTLMFSTMKFTLIICNESAASSPAAPTLLYTRAVVSVAFDGGCGCSAVEERIRDHGLLS